MKKRQIPHTYVIIFYIILFCAVLTWVIPGGQYKESINAAGEKTVVYEAVKHIPQTWQVFSAFYKGFVERADIIVFILIIGGSLEIIASTGVLTVLCKKMSKAFNVSVDEILDNDSKEFLMNKISNTERLAGIIIKILKVIGLVFIGYIIFMIIAVIGLGTYTVVKKDNANVESSATTICSINNKKYQIEFGTNNYFKCNNCSKKMSDEINEIVDFNNIDNSMINIENYFKNNNGTCE